MENTYLSFAIHFHQPVGNFDFVIERAYRECYLPFIEVISDYPEIRMSFHFSGCLLEWIEEKHPEFFEKVKVLVGRSQIDLMTGGFYEPIIPSIPEWDISGQISMLTGYLKSKFDFSADGMWLAERVWEPFLPKILNEAGVKYIILDDTHLRYAGVNSEDIKGYFITEHNGKTLLIFPSDKSLRYSIPFRMPEEVIADIKARGEVNPGSLFTYGDDGEKFGEWPNTYDWVYKKKWLRKFFDALLKESEWLKVVKFSEYLRMKKPEGRVYIPAASYDEMLEWALPSEKQTEFEDIVEEIKGIAEREKYLQFIKGGFWRNFFVKYPEVNQMQKKMFYTSNKIADLKKKKAWSDKRLKNAVKYLYKGQCNCGYWHGVFGGVYSHHIRNAIYRNLVHADFLANSVIHDDRRWISVEKADYDCDGNEEVIISNQSVSLWIAPFERGSIIEFDWLSAHMNLLDTMSRKKEAYHRKIQASNTSKKSRNTLQTIHSEKKIDANLLGNLHYDNYRRSSFMEYFFKERVVVENFINGELTDSLISTCLKDYDFKIKKEKKKVSVCLRREISSENLNCVVDKNFSISHENNKFEVSYKIRKLKGNNLYDNFGVELNFTLPSAGSDGNEIFVNNSCGSVNSIINIIDSRDVNSFGLCSRIDGLKMKISVTSPCRIWSFPVKTISQSERGYDLNYQGTAFLASWDGFKDKKEFKVGFVITLESI